MTVSTDYTQLNNAVTSEFNSQNKSNTASGKNSQLYAEFSAILDKIAFHLNSQAEFSENMQLAAQVEVKVKEIKEVKPKKEAAKVDKPEPAEEPKAKEVEKPKKEEESLEAAKKEEEVIKVEEQVAEEVQAEASGNAEAASADSEEVSSEEAEVAPEELAEELVEEVVEQATDATQQSDAAVLAAQHLKGNTEKVVADNKPVKEEELVFEASANGERQLQDPSNAAAKVAAEVVQEELKPLKEQVQSLKDQIEVVKEPQQLQVESESAGKEQKPFGDLVEQMAKALLGKIQNRESEDLVELATEKIVLDVNANLRPQVETNSDIRSSLLSATMIKQLFAGNEQGLDNAVAKATQIAPQQQVVQAAVPTQTRDQGGSENANSEAAKSKRLPKAFENRTMKRVEEALKEVAKSRDGKTISVRLDPPSLGSVKIDVSMRDGALHARLIAESPAITAFLREKGAELQGILRRLGLDVSDVNVSVGYDNAEGQSSDARDLNQNEYQREQENVLAGMLGGAKEQAASLGSRVEAADDHWIA